MEKLCFILQGPVLIKSKSCYNKVHRGATSGFEAAFLLFKAEEINFERDAVYYITLLTSLYFSAAPASAGFHFALKDCRSRWSDNQTCRTCLENQSIRSPGEGTKEQRIRFEGDLARAMYHSAGSGGKRGTRSPV